MNLKQERAIFEAHAKKLKKELDKLSDKLNDDPLSGLVQANLDFNQFLIDTEGGGRCRS